MSYEEFRRRIDTARNILVGAVPSPAGQIDQITYALIYKFMNDIDDRSRRLPAGRAKYFVGDYEKYSWHNLMAPSVGAHERLELYRQAVQGMSKNPNLPPLFREIYQNAFLPFNSSNVLDLFLKEINTFNHGDSDDIGDAYEYLLSITGAQGDVGQFRTPRHIIKFIVEAVNPTKDDKILDPAVGTAGFLIAAFNHIKSQHDGVDSAGKPNNETNLSYADYDRMHKNFRGFDIDPTMVRTASVNMYLHGFHTPDIRNHDTLSSEQYWNEWYDVILANPPFMTPKGGIQPHKKFGITANRAEVLFVDYIASHLKPNGRAGIIVPEGIIFQSGKAYKELRKNLVENSLYAVVSLPAGVFQPYSGVKTSVLLLDKELARAKDEVLFVNLDNIGVTLDAKQSLKTGNQIPEALNLINAFRNDESIESALGCTVSKSKIAETADCTLLGSRYASIQVTTTSQYPVTELIELIQESRERVKNNSIPVWSVSNKHGFVDPEIHFSKQVASEDTSNYKIVKSNFFAFNPSRINVGSLALNDTGNIGCVSPMYTVFLADESRILPSYLLRQLESSIFNDFVSTMAQGAVRSQLKFADFVRFKIPLPPIEVQREIVAELDIYQRIVDAAQMIVKSYKPTIAVDPKWKVVDLGSTIDFLTDYTANGSFASLKENVSYHRSKNYAQLVRLKDLRKGLMDEDKIYVTKHSYEFLKKSKLKEGDFLIANVGANVGDAYLMPEIDMPSTLGPNMYLVRFDQSIIMTEFAFYLNEIGIIKEAIVMKSASAAQPKINKSDFRSIMIPLPPIESQHEIIAELRAERKLIDANKKLIQIYQQKIKSKIAETWGEN